MRKRLRKKIQTRQRANINFQTLFLDINERLGNTQYARLYHPATRQGFQLEFTLKDGENVTDALAKFMTPPTVEQISDYLFHHAFWPRAEPE